jgi:hypothetical protein
MMEENKRKRLEHKPSFGTGSTELHEAAKEGDLSNVKRIVDDAVTKPMIHTPDLNQWLPIHEASRGGHLEIVELLVEKGADVNARTNHGKGGTPLWLAREAFGDDHPLIRFFESIGAMDLGGEL